MHALFYLLPGAIIGAIITYALPFIIWIPRYLWQIYKGDTAPEGIWYSYHWTRKNHVPHIRFTRWKIRRNFRGQLSVRSWERPASPAYKRSEYSGKGIAFREFGFLVINSTSRFYYGQWTIRVLDPIAPEGKEVPGLWLSFDFDGKLIAGPMVFSRRELTDEQAESLFKSQVFVTHANRQLGVEPARKLMADPASPAGWWPP
jgi:hypothetical protein